MAAQKTITTPPLTAGIALKTGKIDIGTPPIKRVRLRKKKSPAEIVVNVFPE